MKNLLTILLLAILPLVTSACDDDDDFQDRDQRTYLRFFNAVPDVATVDFILNDEIAYPRMGYLSDTGYFRTHTEDQEIRVVVTGTLTNLYENVTTLPDDADRSLFVFGPSDNPRNLFTVDDNEEAGGDIAKARIINLLTGRRAIDVYVVNDTIDIDSVSPTISGLGIGGRSDYFAGDTGTYKIIVTERDSKVPLSTTYRKGLEGNSVYSIVIAETLSGAYPAQIVVLKDH